MAHEQIELGDALQRLMQECQNHTYCDKCPLHNRDEYNCSIIDSGHFPSDWKLIPVIAAML